MWAFAAAMGILAVACDDMPLLAPRESTISLSTASSVVQANGTTEIRATVLEASGTPVHNGTSVVFSTNLGALSPTEARTVAGIATVQFLGNGQSGKATIKAISGGASSEAIEINVGAAAAGRVTLNATPASVPAAGGTTVITAFVADASGNPLGSVPVTFATTAGNFTAAVVNTDSGGIARTTLSTTQQASVTATAGGTTSTALVVTVAVRPTVSITVPSGTTQAEGTITVFTVTVTPATGGAPIQNVVVNYGDGDSDDLGAASGTLSVQHVYQDDGSFTPTVTVTDTSGTSVTASTVVFVQPLLVTISVTSKVPNQANTVVSFTANVSPVSTSIASYTWDFDHGSSLVTADKSATHAYPTVPGREYTVRVVARTSTGHTAVGTTKVAIP